MHAYKHTDRHSYSRSTLTTALALHCEQWHIQTNKQTNKQSLYRTLTVCTHIQRWLLVIRKPATKSKSVKMHDNLSACTLHWTHTQHAISYITCVCVSTVYESHIQSSRVDCRLDWRYQSPLWPLLVNKDNCLPSHPSQSHRPEMGGVWRGGDGGVKRKEMTAASGVRRVYREVCRCMGKWGEKWSRLHQHTMDTHTPVVMQYAPHPPIPINTQSAPTSGSPSSTPLDLPLMVPKHYYLPHQP